MGSVVDLDAGNEGGDGGGGVADSENLIYELAGQWIAEQQRRHKTGIWRIRIDGWTYMVIWWTPGGWPCLADSLRDVTGHQSERIGNCTLLFSLLAAALLQSWRLTFSIFCYSPRDQCQLVGFSKWGAVKRRSWLPKPVGNFNERIGGRLATFSPGGFSNRRAGGLPEPAWLDWGWRAAGFSKPTSSEVAETVPSHFDSKQVNPVRQQGNEGEFVVFPCISNGMRQWRRLAAHLHVAPKASSNLHTTICIWRHRLVR